MPTPASFRYAFRLLLGLGVPSAPVGQARAQDATADSPLPTAAAVMERTRSTWHLTKELRSGHVTSVSPTHTLHRDRDFGAPLVQLSLDGTEQSPDGRLRLWAITATARPPQQGSKPTARIGVPVAALSKALQELTPFQLAVPWNGAELLGEGRLQEEDRITSIDGEPSSPVADSRWRLRRAFARGRVELQVERRGVLVLLQLDLRPVVEPLSGDCHSGEGRARMPTLGAIYEGRFANGLPAGPGRLTLADGELLIGWFERGLPGAPMIDFITWNNAGGSNAICRRGRVVDLKMEWLVELPAWCGPNGKEPGRSLDGYEHGPVVLARGERLRRIEEQDLCEVRFPKWGIYTGRFVDGVAQGQGLLVRPDGTTQKFDCLQGVPALVTTLLETSGERMRYVATLGDRLLPIGDCLRGNARDGYGKLILARDANLSTTIYEGGLRAGRPHGQGKLQVPEGQGFSFPTVYEGPFVDGARHGRFWVAAGGLPPRQEDYANDQFVAHVQPVARAKAPPPPARQPRTYVSKCYACDGYGTVRVKAVTYVNDTFFPFMPGSRHYGSWLWQGTYDPSKTREEVVETAERCIKCQGKGRVQIAY